ncbi:hypothetical protein B0J17DRAFT_634136 [Rhizoctonia solani]|nr:hypothetical protein B0J17DRAFT_634136 [Rhizoctonia solani]
MYFTSAMEADTLTLAARPPILPHESTSSGYWTMITPRGRTGRPPQLINHEIGMGMKDYQGPRLGLLCCVRPRVGYLSVGAIQGDEIGIRKTPFGEVGPGTGRIVRDGVQRDEEIKILHAFLTFYFWSRSSLRWSAWEIMVMVMVKWYRTGSLREKAPILALSK